MLTNLGGCRGRVGGRVDAGLLLRGELGRGRCEGSAGRSEGGRDLGLNLVAKVGRRALLGGGEGAEAREEDGSGAHSD